MIRLKPSVLKVASTSHTAGSENNNNSNGDRDREESQSAPEKVHSDNMFKFAPLAKAQIGNASNGAESKASSENQAKQQSLSTEAQSRGFLFGQNLEERVLLPSEAESSNSSANQQNISEPQSEASNSLNDSNQISQNFPEKRKYEAITGEEDESNVLQIYCKLYLWDSSISTWKERGKGMLRLNDKIKDDKLCSRLIMRTSGSLKVILNASIVGGMKFGISGENCLRFANIDGIYLVKGKEKEIDQLHSAIDCRLRELAKKIKTSDEEESYGSKAKEEDDETSKEAEKFTGSESNPVANTVSPEEVTKSQETETETE